jgi:hypothetical protein
MAGSDDGRRSRTPLFRAERSLELIEACDYIVLDSWIFNEERRLYATQGIEDRGQAPA